MASRLARACVLASLIAQAGRAGETPLLMAGALADSASATVAPVMVFRAPLSGDRTFTASQIGWTTALGLEAPQDRRWTLQTTAALTPIRAHLSHDIYDPQGHRQTAGEFDDTSLRVTAGTMWKSGPASIRAHAVVGKEWVSKLTAVQGDAFAAPFGGVETTWILQSLRSDDPLSGHFDGAVGRLHAEGLLGTHPWVDGDLALSFGRKAGRLFSHLDADAFYVSFDHPVTAVLVGGSWDALGGAALMGHPVGAFRLARGAAAMAGIDLELASSLELGLRGSVLAGAPSVHSGVALIAQGTVSGVHLFAGAGSPDGEVFRGALSRTSVFFAVNAGLLFLP